MARTWQQVWLAALVIAVLGSGCVLSCLSASQPVVKADAHACCHKNQKQDQSPDSKTDCHSASAELAKAPVQVALSAVVLPEAALPVVAVAHVADSPVYSPPDLLALHRTLLI